MNSVLVIGDSNATPILRGFKQRGWSAYGGTLQAGVEYEAPFFEATSSGVVLTNPVAQERLTKALKSAGASSFVDLSMPIVSTIGFNSVRLANALFRQDGVTISDEPPKWSSAVVRELVAAVRAPAIAFYRALPADRTYAVLSPQRTSASRLGTVQTIERLFVDALTALGVKIIDIRNLTTGPDGLLKPEFFLDDPRDAVHANADYGALVADRLAEMMNAR